VKPSAEVRWFYRGKMSKEVRDWFCGAKLCKEEMVRTDYYIAFPGSNDVGVKVRDGRKLEIKARTKAPEPFSLATGASVGRQDVWTKWSHEDREVAGRLAALAGNSPEWVAVAKKRWVRKFHLDASGNVVEVDPDTELDHGCSAELTELIIRDSHWWTLAFESFGEENRPVNLEQVARHFLKVLPHGLALTERDSMAYPEWLNRLSE